jgi:hypothetical protein
VAAKEAVEDASVPLCFVETGHGVTGSPRPHIRYGSPWLCMATAPCMTPASPDLDPFRVLSSHHGLCFPEGSGLLTWPACPDSRPHSVQTHGDKTVSLF